MRVVGEWVDTLRKLGEGDVSACDRLTRLITSYLVAMGAYRMKDSWDDLIQDVLLSLLQASLRAPESRAAIALIRTTTYRKYIDLLRRERGRRRASPNGVEPAAVGWRSSVSLQDVEKEIASEEDVAVGLDMDLRRALDRLDPRVRDAIERRYVMGFSNEEGAAQTGKSLGTFKRLLERGRKELRGMLLPDEHPL